jgi:hypothetical protein
VGLAIVADHPPVSLDIAEVEGVEVFGGAEMSAHTKKADLSAGLPDLIESSGQYFATTGLP